MRIARLLLATSTALAFSAVVAGAQNRGAPAMAEDAARLRAAIQDAQNRAAFSYNRGDVAGFIRPYAEDVWVFPPNEQPFQGPNAALDYFKRSYDGGFRNLQLTTTGVDRSASMAYETGIWSGEFPTSGQGGAMSRDNGKYVAIWKRAPNGEWRMHLVTWNSNNPPPPMSR